jgi:hypothetical protein
MAALRANKRLNNTGNGWRAIVRAICLKNRAEGVRQGERQVSELVSIVT